MREIPATGKRAAAISALFLILGLGGCQSPLIGHRLSSSQGPVYSVYFSPRGGCTAQVAEALGQARRRVRVQAYSFTSQPIAAALIAAHRRGVDVEVILDKSQRTARGSAAGDLAEAGVPVAIDEAHAIAHNKVMVIDEQTVITGSFNFTASAEERNAENLLIVQDPQLAARYEQNWHAHRAHALPYQTPP